MFENKEMKIVGKLLLLGVVGFVAFLLLDQQGHLSLHREEEKSYVTVPIDSTIDVLDLHPKSPNEVVDSIHIPDFTLLKTTTDSDSMMRYDLYRHEQAVVTIDMEEHKEAVFFTWEDIKSYFAVLGETIDKLIHKK